ncbi:rRNA processing protein Ebp2 [Magnaporthiopsis poae ATCC 64411]|uniref:rRNA processing protein Ebp2 n=1 Tax=Magnaporthiopsis poae (strain ATCC 64411 / 73-15) TaxID=644358 RepID=A0A0C4DWL7_MAGP6|nr:rRNA processing protein Ebp2 [Magnaporthiopsis poae ATCC 64411]
MVTKSKLKLALAAEKGIDLRKKKEQRRIKAIHKVKEKRKSASKGRPASAADEDEDDWEDEGSDEDENDNAMVDVEAEEDSDDDEEEEDECLDAARRARALLRAEGVPFSRPADYFAEMVKPDEHMEKVKAKLVEDATAKKAAAEARKLRDLKKFGKQVQVAKLQERAKAKKDTLEKISSLKRKRQESSAALPEREADLFDVGVDNELKQHRSAGAGGANGKNGKKGPGGRGEPGRKRQKKNEKYGFGGKKKFSKSGDAISSGDLSGFNNSKRTKGKSAPRPGKSKRLARASKR